jgi:hypothetical protein
MSGHKLWRQRTVNRGGGLDNAAFYTGDIGNGHVAGKEVGAVLQNSWDGERWYANHDYVACTQAVCDGGETLFGAINNAAL